MGGTSPGGVISFTIYFNGEQVALWRENGRIVRAKVIPPFADRKPCAPAV